MAESIKYLYASILYGDDKPSELLRKSYGQWNWSYKGAHFKIEPEVLKKFAEMEVK